MLPHWRTAVGCREEGGDEGRCEGIGWIRRGELSTTRMSMQPAGPATGPLARRQVTPGWQTRATSGRSGALFAIGAHSARKCRRGHPLGLHSLCRRLARMAMASTQSGHWAEATWTVGAIGASGVDARKGFLLTGPQRHVASHADLRDPKQGVTHETAAVPSDPGSAVLRVVLGQRPSSLAHML